MQMLMNGTCIINELLLYKVIAGQTFKLYFVYVENLARKHNVFPSEFTLTPIFRLLLKMVKKIILTVTKLIIFDTYRFVLNI